MIFSKNWAWTQISALENPEVRQPLIFQIPGKNIKSGSLLMTRYNIYDAGIKVYPEALTKRITTVIVLWYQSKHTESFNEGNRLWYGISLSMSHIQQNGDFRDLTHLNRSIMWRACTISYWLFPTSDVRFPLLLFHLSSLYHSYHPPGFFEDKAQQETTQIQHFQYL